MGFILNNGQASLVAKLTPLGRETLMKSDNNAITHFSLGDSDANYNISNPLPMGRIPVMSGDRGSYGSQGSSTYFDNDIRDKIYVNSQGLLKKEVGVNSYDVLSDVVSNGYETYFGSAIESFKINRTDTIDPNGNLFKSLGLPISSVDQLKYNTTRVQDGGYFGSVIQNFNHDEVAIISIGGCEYGEVIDGKTVKVKLVNTDNTTTYLYSSFDKNMGNRALLDTKFVGEGPIVTSLPVNNTVLLFSDERFAPNGDTLGKSWATGHNVNKPFSNGGKETFNNLSIGGAINQDQAVGYAVLDKGFIVITDPVLVAKFNTDTINHNEVSFDSYSTEIYQNIMCTIERDEFALSTNSTYTEGDKIRLSEIALYDINDNVLAFSKLNTHLTIGSSQLLVLMVKITV